MDYLAILRSDSISIFVTRSSTYCYQSVLSLFEQSTKTTPQYVLLHGNFFFRDSCYNQSHASCISRFIHSITSRTWGLSLSLPDYTVQQFIDDERFNQEHADVIHLDTICSML